MAVVFVEGFDTYNGVGSAASTSTSVGLLSRWSCPNVGTINSPLMVTGRFGGQATSVHQATDLYPIYTNLPGAYTSGTIGVALFATNAISTLTAPIFAVGQGGVYRTSTDQLFVAPNASGAISVYRGGATPTLLGTSAAGVLLANTWQYMEMEYVISSTVGSVKVYINGVSVLSLTGVNTQALATNTVSAIYLEGAVNAGRTYFDDLYVTDTPNRLGEQRVITSYPSSDVLTTYWSSSTLGAAPYTMIDEATCDADVTYVSSSTYNSRLVVGVPSLPVAAVDVNAVQITGFARKDETQFRQLALEYQNTAGSVATGPTKTLTPSYAYVNALYPQNPLTGTAWTGTDVNNMRIGARVVS